MKDFWEGLGIAVIILAICLGPAGCHYIEAKAKAIEERDWAVASMKSKCSARRIGPNTIEWRSGYYCWWETVELPVGFTNTPMEYLPRFLLKD